MAQASIYVEQNVKRSSAKLSKKTIAVIAIGVVILTIAFVLYSHRTESNKINASNEYSLVLGALQRDDNVMATNHALALIKKYKNSPYAKLSALVLAKFAFNDNDFALAKERLTWVIETSEKDELLQPIAISRLARLLVHNQEYDAALALIAKHTFSGRFSVIIEEVRGDALLAKGDRDAAIRSYQIVAANMSDKVDLRWLEEKLNELGVERNVIEAETNKNN